MIRPSDEQCFSGDVIEKTPPEVVMEEDVPFQKENGGPDHAMEDLSTEENINDKFNWKKLSIGSSALGWCMFLMLFCVVLSMISPGKRSHKRCFRSIQTDRVNCDGIYFWVKCKKVNK